MERFGDGHKYRHHFHVKVRNTTIEDFAEQVKLGTMAFLKDVEYAGKCEIGHEAIMYNTFKIKCETNIPCDCINMTFEVETLSIPATYGALLRARKEIREAELDKA